MHVISLNTVNADSENLTISDINNALEIVEQRCGDELVDYIKSYIHDGENDITCEVKEAQRKAIEPMYCELDNAINEVKEALSDNTTVSKTGKKKTKLNKEMLTNLISNAEYFMNVVNAEIDLY